MNTGERNDLDNFNKLPPEEQLSLLLSLKMLHAGVSTLQEIWKVHPNYNNDINIANILPSSLDEWALDIKSHIDEYESRMLKHVITCKRCGGSNLELDDSELRLGESLLYYTCLGCGSEHYINFIPGMVDRYGKLLYPTSVFPEE